MRYGIFSDVHSNWEALEAVINAYQKESIDKYLCGGDIVGYAAGPKECIEKIKELAMPAVAGNHDWASVNLFYLGFFNPAAKEAILWTQRYLDEGSRHFLESLKLVHKNEDFTLVHGTLHEPQDFNYMTDGYAAQETFKLLETNICFVAHSHIPGIFVRDIAGDIYYREDASLAIKEHDKYIINVGSVGQPRDGNPDASYCIYDTDERKVQIKRARYDCEKSRRKIIEAGLPRYLGDRLLIGR